MLKYFILIFTLPGSIFCQADFSYLMYKHSLMPNKELFVSNKAILPASWIPEVVKFNADFDVKNPLYNQAVSCCSLFKDNLSILAGSLIRPVVVIESYPDTIFMINKSGEETEVLSAVNFSTGTHTKNVPDALGKITSKIVSIEIASSYIFALTCPSQDVLGQKGTGVMLSAVGEVALNEKGGFFTGLIIIDALTGQLARPEGNRTTPLDVTSDFLKIGHDLQSISAGRLLWHRGVNRLYAALKIQCASGENDGGRALVLGQFDPEGKSLSFHAVAPASTFMHNNDAVIGGVGAFLKISLDKIIDFQTDSGLSYMIGIGGIGHQNEASKKVFCLPLVNNEGADSCGMIASKSCVPELNPKSGRLELSQAASDENDLPVYSDLDVMVGNGSLELPVQDVFVQGNTIMCVTEVKGEAIVFVSKPYFGKSGKISHWSDWSELHRFQMN